MPAEFEDGIYLKDQDPTPVSDLELRVVDGKAILVDPATGLEVSKLSAASIEDGADGTAIHADVVGEIAAVTVKATPVSGDLILIEDSADSNNKKSITIGTLPGGSDQTSNRFLTAQDFMIVGSTGPSHILINSQVPVREFAGTGSDDEMWGQIGIPERLVGTTLTTKLHYASSGTNVTDFKMWIDYISTTDGEDIGASVTTISEVWTGTGTADEHDIVTFSSTITVAPGEILHVRVYRDPDALADSNSDGVRFIALEFEFAERQGPLPPTSSLLTGLVAFWPMHETSGDRYDVSGNSHTLTDVNSVLSEPGVIGNAALFVRANSEYFTLTRIDFADGVEWSYALWSKLDDATHSAYFSDTGSTNWYAHSSYSGGTQELYAPGGSDWYGDGSSDCGKGFSTGGWHHVAIVCDGTDTNMVTSYLDGVPSDTALAGVLNPSEPNAGSDNSAMPIDRIGRAASNYQSGAIQLMGVWDRALTADEVSALYASGSGLDYPFS